jgi:hypothetical protein
MCRLSRNLGASTCWNPVMGLLYLFFNEISSLLLPRIELRWSSLSASALLMEVSISLHKRIRRIQSKTTMFNIVQYWYPLVTSRFWMTWKMDARDTTSCGTRNLIFLVRWSVSTFIECYPNIQWLLRRADYGVNCILGRSGLKRGQWQGRLTAAPKMSLILLLLLLHTHTNRGTGVPKIHVSVPNLQISKSTETMLFITNFRR